MCDRADRLDQLGAEAVFVVHDDAESVRGQLLDGLDVPFPVLLDEQRGAYTAWGLTRASWAGIWLDPGVWRAYARLLRSGERLRSAGRDTRQLGGDFVIAAEGRIAYSRPQRRDDRPPVGELLNRVRDLTG